jgi:hypothetical protein
MRPKCSSQGHVPQDPRDWRRGSVCQRLVRLQGSKIYLALYAPCRALKLCRERDEEVAEFALLGHVEVRRLIQFRSQRNKKARPSLV